MSTSYKWDFTPILSTYNALDLSLRQQFIDELKSYANQLIQNDNMQSHEHTNPKYIGPGTWNVMHTLAYNARTKSQQQAFCDTVHTLIYQFPCEVCRQHAINYLKQYPITDYLNDKMGMFVWTWKFHNRVNFRINKQPMSYEMAEHIYSKLAESTINHEVCTKECSDSDNPVSKKTVKMKTIHKLPQYK